MEKFCARSEMSFKLRSTTAFVYSVLGSWIQGGIAERSQKSVLDYEHQNRTIYWLKKNYASRQTISSNLLARQLLHCHRKTASPEPVTEKPAPQHDKGPPVLKRTGMNSPMVLSKEMQEFVGHDMLARFELINHLGNYIKEKSLHVKGNRRKFVMDDTLSRLLGVDGDHSMLALQKLVSKHLIQPKQMGPEYEERANQIFENYLKERGAVDSKRVPRRRDPRGLNSLNAQKELQAKGKGMYADVMIDPCLRPICGGRDRMPRPQILKAVWDYIKSRDLQDPQNRRFIIVDDGLRHGLQITDTKSIDSFHVGRYLWKLCKESREK